MGGDHTVKPGSPRRALEPGFRLPSLHHLELLYLPHLSSLRSDLTSLTQRLQELHVSVYLIYVLATMTNR